MVIYRELSDSIPGQWDRTVIILGVYVDRPRLRPAMRLGLAVLVLLGVSACRKAAKTSKPDDNSSTFGGLMPGNANNNSGGGIISPARPPLPAGWREFQHPDGAYSIYVPAQPRHDPMSSPSLKLAQPLGPNEARETLHGTLPTAKQPYLIEMRVQVFDASLQSVLEQSYASNRPKDDLNHKWTAYRDVTWAGRSAKESVCEKTFLLGANIPPKRIYSVSRYLFTPGRLYAFLIERENQMPSNTDLSAFFDSFVVGG